MRQKLVRDLMIPLSEYVVVSSETTLKEALRTLLVSHEQLTAGRHPHRAVLVADQKGEIVGKLGQRGFLEALEPKYKVLGDVERLPKAGLSEGFVNTIMDDLRFWQDDLQVVCSRAGTIRIDQVMKPMDARIDESASLTEAIHLIVMAQALSILVTRHEKVVGILRLSDLFVEVARFVTSADCQ
jgi:CBS domain-containing protein